MSRVLANIIITLLLASSALEVKITDDSGRAVPGIRVAFRIIAQPDLEDGALLSHLLVQTDSLGLAQKTLTLGSETFIKGRL